MSSQYKVRSVNLHRQRDRDLIEWTDKLTNFGGFVRDLLYQAKEAAEGNDQAETRLSPDDITQIRRIVSLELDRALRNIAVNVPANTAPVEDLSSLTELEENLLSSSW